VTDQPAAAVAIVACRDLAASEAFYARLGFTVTGRFPAHDYAILANADGAALHLALAPAGWLDPARNPAGVYLYARDVDTLALRFDVTAEQKSWGLREFAVSDPDGTLIRVGWPG
jgi:catechol 2,3-dioxygenase-like lactoylglutathione lyase family enzyme